LSFLSFEWIGWICATVSLYWLSPQKHRDLLLIVITAVFLGYHSAVSLGVLFLLSLIVYQGTQVKEVSDARIIVLTCIILAILVYFKVAVYVGGEGVLGQAIIPLGLSYYSFRCFHYVFERYRGSVEDHSFFELLAYLFFIPTILVGPINRSGPFFADLRNKVWSSNDLSYGIERILYGYAKITVLSGFLVNRVLYGYSQTIAEEHILFRMYLDISIDGLDLYFLFAGYSDIAIGFARLLGFRILENFHWPYFQKNISDFWRCWHISLSGWCRDYVYFPVVGLTRNPYLGTLATFITIGLWHEISARYILWGLWHGVGILIWRQFQLTKRRLRLPKIQSPLWSGIATGTSIFATVNYVWFGLVIVTAESLTGSLAVYKAFLFDWW
jgi:alginate O-acetyltransferase complex protein AlgI